MCPLPTLRCSRCAIISSGLRCTLKVKLEIYRSNVSPSPPLQVCDRVPRAEMLHNMLTYLQGGNVPKAHVDKVSLNSAAGSQGLLIVTADICMTFHLTPTAALVLLNLPQVAEICLRGLSWRLGPHFLER